jgi:hypothetical protein
MDIVTKDWTCVHCHKIYADKIDRPLQIDYIDNTHVLVSNYTDQKLIAKPDYSIMLNACYCYPCVNVLTVMSSNFESEPKYTFGQEGYICWEA